MSDGETNALVRACLCIGIALLFVASAVKQDLAAMADYCIAFAILITAPPR